MQTILVTGGSGFVGSHLCRRLVGQGHHVISLDNNFIAPVDHVPGVEYRVGHTKQIAALVPEAPSLVYHLGEYSRVEVSFRDMDVLWDLNIVGTFATLQFCVARNVKVIYAGSSTKFGDQGIGRHQSPYAWTKATNTELVRNFNTWFGLRYAITYFYNVYGPGERSGPYGTVIEIFRQEYLNRKPLPVVRPGTQRRHFTHVDDIVDGLLLVGERGEGDGFDLGDPCEYSILDIVDLFETDHVLIPERPGNRMGSTIDTSKARTLGWKATRTIEAYIKAIIKNTSI